MGGEALGLAKAGCPSIEECQARKREWVAWGAGGGGMEYGIFGEETRKGDSI